MYMDVTPICLCSCTVAFVKLSIVDWKLFFSNQGMYTVGISLIAVFPNDLIQWNLSF